MLYLIAFVAITVSASKFLVIAEDDCGGFVNVKQFERFARRTMAPSPLNYIDSVGLEGETFNDNERAFKRLKIRPRYMRNVDNVDVSTTILGFPVEFPVGISPHGAQRMSHPDGENNTAKAAKSAGVIMVVSTTSSIPLELVSQSAPGGILWFQIQIFKERNLTIDFIKRAELSQYKALVVSIDDSYSAVRYGSLGGSSGSSNFDMRDLLGGNYKKYREGEDDHITKNAGVLVPSDPTITWEDITWLKKQTKLPIVIKGILTGEDANLAIAHGASAIFVSNCGGRQLDGVPATIDVLSEIVQVVKGRVEVYLDSGVRTGSDVFKALALGARAVFYGRPNLWGISYKGEIGGKCVLDIMKRDLKSTMALAGFRTIESIESSAIIKDDFYKVKCPQFDKEIRR